MSHREINDERELIDILGAGDIPSNDPDLEDLIGNAMNLAHDYPGVSTLVDNESHEDYIELVIRIPR